MFQLKQKKWRRKEILLQKALEERILTFYARTFVELGSQLQLAAECEQMNPQQLCLLVLLRERGALAVGELSAGVHMNRGNCSTACKRLEGDGLVRRRRKESDERVVLIELTAAGEVLLDRIQSHACDELLGGLRSLTEEQEKRLLQSIEAIEELLGCEEIRKGNQNHER